MKYTHIYRGLNILGKVMNYCLEEETGKEQCFTDEEVKELMSQGHEFINICLDESGNIIDNK